MPSGLKFFVKAGVGTLLAAGPHRTPTRRGLGIPTEVLSTRAHPTADPAPRTAPATPTADTSDRGRGSHVNTGSPVLVRVLSSSLDSRLLLPCTQCTAVGAYFNL